MQLTILEREALLAAVGEVLAGPVEGTPWEHKPLERAALERASRKLQAERKQRPWVKCSICRAAVPDTPSVLRDHLHGHNPNADQLDRPRDYFEKP